MRFISISRWPFASPFLIVIVLIRESVIAFVAPYIIVRPMCMSNLQHGSNFTKWYPFVSRNTVFYVIAQPTGADRNALHIFNVMRFGLLHWITGRFSRTTILQLKQSTSRNGFAVECHKLALMPINQSTSSWTLWATFKSSHSIKLFYWLKRSHP